MTLLYKPIKSQVAGKDGKKKWHPVLVKVGNVVDTQRIGEMIAKRTTASPPDVHLVLRALIDIIGEQLLDGHSVLLNGLGTFTVIARSNGKGVDTEAEVSSEQITRLRIRFMPVSTRKPGEGTTRAIFKDVEYERIDKKLAGKDPTPSAFKVASVTNNGTLVSQGSGILEVLSGDVLEINGTGLANVTLKARVLTDPTGTAYVAPLTELGTIAVSSATLIRINVTKVVEVYHLLRADTSAVVYSFQ